MAGNTSKRDIIFITIAKVERRLQIEGQVTHVIVSACYNFSKLLRHLTATQKKQAALMTLPRARHTPFSIYLLSGQVSIIG
jgi:error-prone DNA polymerase